MIRRSRFTVLVVLIAFVFPPLSSSAATLTELQVQLAAVLAQIKQLQSSGMGTAPACVSINRTLTLTVKGNDVSDVQRFLTTTGDYTYGEITGYFGSATQEAVRRFQTRNAIVTSGTPQTTGYGSVGPMTRRIMSEQCGNQVPQVVTPSAQSSTPSTVDPIEAALSKLDTLLGASDAAAQEADTSTE